ncbi:MAG: hypothetical protein ACOYK8_09425 [Alphaproteobacteria bacterium]
MKKSVNILVVLSLGAVLVLGVAFYLLANMKISPPSKRVEKEIPLQVEQ